MSVKKNIEKITLSFALLLIVIFLGACSGNSDAATEVSQTVNAKTTQSITAETTAKAEDASIPDATLEDYLSVFLKNRDFYVIAESGLKLRKDKGSDSEAMDTIPLSEKLKISEVQPASDAMLWGKTEYKGETGWVCMKYLTEKTASIFVGKKFSLALDELGDYVSKEYVAGGACYAWFNGEFWLHTEDTQYSQVDQKELTVLKQEIIGDYVVPGNLRSNMSYNELCASVAEKPQVEFVEADYGCYVSKLTQGYYEYQFTWEPDESGSLPKDSDASSLTIRLNGTQAPDEYMLDMNDEQNCNLIFDVQTVENRDMDESGNIRYITSYEKPVAIAGTCAEKINSYYDKAVSDFIGSEADRKETVASAAAKDVEFSHNSKTYILTNSEKLISVVHDNCLDVGGTAPYSYASECFDAKTGELMTLPQVLGKTEAETREIIVASILSYIQYREELSKIGDRKTIEEKVGNLELNELAFYVARNGYTVMCFNPYMISDGATGRLLIPVVT